MIFAKNPTLYHRVHKRMLSWFMHCAKTVVASRRTISLKTCIRTYRLMPVY